MNQMNYQPLQRPNHQNEKRFKYKAYINLLAIISTVKYFLGIIYSGIIIAYLPTHFSLVEDEEDEKDEMISLSKSDNRLATAHIVLCLI